jgi:hypothetical protein
MLSASAYDLKTAVTAPLKLLEKMGETYDRYLAHT